MGSVFLRNDIGIPSESLSAKMERVLASLRVQNYNAKKGNPNFLQICSVSKYQNRLTLPVFIGVNLFFLYRESVQNFKKSFDAVFCFRLKKTRYVFSLHV